MVCPDFCLVWEKGEEGGRFERELTERELGTPPSPETRRALERGLLLAGDDAGGVRAGIGKGGHHQRGHHGAQAGPVVQVQPAEVEEVVEQALDAALRASGKALPINIDGALAAVAIK